MNVKERNLFLETSFNRELFDTLQYFRNYSKERKWFVFETRDVRDTQLKGIWIFHAIYNASVLEKNISNDLSLIESFRSKKGETISDEFYSDWKKPQRMREKKKKVPKFMLISLQMVGVVFFKKRSLRGKIRRVTASTIIISCNRRTLYLKLFLTYITYDILFAWVFFCNIIEVGVLCVLFSLHKDVHWLLDKVLCGSGSTNTHLYFWFFKKYSMLLLQHMQIFKPVYVVSVFHIMVVSVALHLFTQRSGFSWIWRTDRLWFTAILEPDHYSICYNGH